MANNEYLRLSTRTHIRIAYAAHAQENNIHQNRQSVFEIRFFFIDFDHRHQRSINYY